MTQHCYRWLLREVEVTLITAPQVDVEGAELEVLRGAGEETLLKIRQIVVEVHDIDGRVTEVHQLLERIGFTILGTEKGVCHTKLVFAAQKRPLLVAIGCIRSPAS